MSDGILKTQLKFTNHPKASAAVVAAAAGTLLIALLKHFGVDLTAAEQGAVNTLFVAAAAYLAPNQGVTQ